MTNKTLSYSILFLIIIKIVALYFTNFNLFGDEAQYWLWSKELDFGYFSKPPFLAWFIYIYTIFFGDSFIALKIIPSLIYVLIAIAFYDLCKNIGLTTTNSLFCGLMFISIPAVSFSSFILSTDIFLLLFWVLSLNELIKIKNEPRIINFILLGIMLGLAFLSKYAAIYFIICFILYVFLDNSFRNLFSRNIFKFLISLFCLLLIVFPNIVWNLNNGWVTFQHTSDNANFGNIKISFLRGLEFLGIQILMLGPFLFLANIINYKNIKIEWNQKFLLIFSLPVFFIVFVEAIIVRANANWAAPALITFFLFLYISVLNINSFYLKLNLFFNFSFCIIFFLLIGISYPSSIFKRISGLNEYANMVFSYGKEVNVEDYVVSDRLSFASISYELRDKNITLHMPHKKNDKITNHFKIAYPLDKEINKNFILIGPVESINYLKNNFTIKEKKLFYKNKYEKEFFVYEVRFN